MFKMDPHELVDEADFGGALRPTFVSDFKWNEFDRLDFDIKDVADAETLRAFADGTFVIRTVRDYCDHMARCYRVNPDEVIHVLELKVP